MCWLEDTLIELYLSGYSNQDIKVTNDVTKPLQMDECEKLELPFDGLSSYSPIHHYLAGSGPKWVSLVGLQGIRMHTI